MIAAAAIISCAGAAWLRLALGDSSPFVPWMGLAWTLLFARHSRRATFAGPALVLGAIDGIAAPAAWTAWPIAYLVAGALFFGARRLLPARGALGECVAGAIGAAMVRVLVLPFAPFDLPSAGTPLGPAAAGAVLTGIALAVLVLVSELWDPLRMKLARVS